MSPEIVVGMVGCVEGVVKAGEWKRGKGDNESFVEDRWGDDGLRANVGHDVFISILRCSGSRCIHLHGCNL